MQIPLKPGVEMTVEGLMDNHPSGTFAQIIPGKAGMVINKVCTLLETGMGIIIPAHTSNMIKPNGRFKMIQAIIKSGYDEVALS